MPFPWIAVLQSVPWVDVIRSAPKVAEGAKRLWNSVSGKPPLQKDNLAERRQESVDSGELLTRLQAAETEIAALHVQMLASTELIKSLAEQNAVMANGMEAYRRSLSRLSIISLLMLAVFCVTLFIVISGR